MNNTLLTHDTVQGNLTQIKTGTRIQLKIRNMIFDLFEYFQIIYQNAMLHNSAWCYIMFFDLWLFSNNLPQQTQWYKFLHVGMWYDHSVMNLIKYFTTKKRNPTQFCLLIYDNLQII